VGNREAKQSTSIVLRISLDRKGQIECVRAPKVTAGKRQVQMRTFRGNIPEQNRCQPFFSGETKRREKSAQARVYMDRLNGTKRLRNITVT
jgi:hypothetical protein